NSLLQINDSILNNGIIEAFTVSGNTPLLEIHITGDVSGTGAIEIFNLAMVEIGGSVSFGQKVFLEVQQCRLILDNSLNATFDGLITGTALGTQITETDLIDLKDLQFTATMSASVLSQTATTTTIDFTNGTANVTLTFSGNYTDSWAFANDG